MKYMKNSIIIFNTIGLLLSFMTSVKASRTYDEDDDYKPGFSNRYLYEPQQDIDELIEGMRNFSLGNEESTLNNPISGDLFLYETYTPPKQSYSLVQSVTETIAEQINTSAPSKIRRIASFVGRGISYMLYSETLFYTIQSSQTMNLPVWGAYGLFKAVNFGKNFVFSKESTVEERFSRAFKDTFIRDTVDDFFIYTAGRIFQAIFDDYKIEFMQEGAYQTLQKAREFNDEISSSGGYLEGLLSWTVGDVVVGHIASNALYYINAIIPVNEFAVDRTKSVTILLGKQLLKGGWELTKAVASGINHGIKSLWRSIVPSKNPTPFSQYATKEPLSFDSFARRERGGPWINEQSYTQFINRHYQQ
jgi:hypothetical protein